jgi:hypothetical protein
MMLDTYFYQKSNAEPYYQDDHFNIWKFAGTGKTKQKKPVILNYSIMTRAYGTCFNQNSFIDFFNRYGFDVYLMDWGKTSFFTLPGWTLDTLADSLRDKAVEPLLGDYKVDSLNVFGICIGGLITAHLINRELKKNPGFAKKFDKIAFYGSPIIGNRDLGMQKTFMLFYKTMKPYQNWLQNTGISLFTLDACLLNGVSNAMLDWSWESFWEEGSKTYKDMLELTYDDRWVPFAAFMDILGEAFNTQNGNGNGHRSFHFDGNVSNIHFYNLVGNSDLLVKPSASIVEWGSDVPKQFASFEQEIVDGGHFIFAEPGYVAVKEKMAKWFAGVQK